MHVVIHRPPSSSFLALPYRLVIRILNINHKKELLTGLWVLWSDVEGSLMSVA